MVSQVYIDKVTITLWKTLHCITILIPMCSPSLLIVLICLHYFLLSMFLNWFIHNWKISWNERKGAWKACPGSEWNEEMSKLDYVVSMLMYLLIRKVLTVKVQCTRLCTDNGINCLTLNVRLDPFLIPDWRVSYFDTWRKRKERVWMEQQKHC